MCIMSKEFWKAGNMVYPLPAVLISCGVEGEKPNVFTVAWTGTICTNPAMVYISVRPERYSYHMIEQSKEFVINLTNEKLAKATDFCGVRSGRNVDKFKEMNLTPVQGKCCEYAPLIEEAPVSIECKVVDIQKLGSHHMFIANVLGVHVDKSYMNEKGKFELGKAEMLVYSHGEYYGLGNLLGTFGYSVRKEKPTKANPKNDELNKNNPNNNVENKKSSKKSNSNSNKTQKYKTHKSSSSKYSPNKNNPSKGNPSKNAGKSKKKTSK